MAVAVAVSNPKQAGWDGDGLGDPMPEVIVGNTVLSMALNQCDRCSQIG